MSGTGPDQATRLIVLERDDWRCVACGNDVSRGGGEIHHRRPRMAGGSRDERINLPSNLLTLCLVCHRYVESYRDNARACGLLLDNVADAGRPVWRGADRQWWVYGHTGSRERLTADEVIEYVNSGLIDHPNPVRRGDKRS